MEMMPSSSDGIGSLVSGCPKRLEPMGTLIIFLIFI
jgi:hypothetical protein